jgi:putative hydrolase of the HAD superfamily
MQITAVIFDYGCVLSLPPRPEDYEPLRKTLGADASVFQELYWRHREVYDRDGLPRTAYWEEMVCAIGGTATAQQIEKLITLDNQLWGRRNPVMVEWARLLRRRGLQIAVLSNMSRNVGDYLRRTAKWLELFHHLCFSGELKITKPNPAIYHACLATLGVPAAQTLFIDDREVNIPPALAMGMHGIVFHSTEQLQTDLAPYGLAESLAEALKAVTSDE